MPVIDGRILDLSVVADDGAASAAALAIIPVVSRSVRGRFMDAFEAAEGVVAGGVPGSESCVFGVSTRAVSRIGVLIASVPELVAFKMS